MPIVVNLSGTTFTNTSLPKLTRDPFITHGTQWLFDFKNTYCWASQNAPGVGAVFKNLVDGGTDAVFDGASADGFSGGGIILDTGTGKVVNIGTGYNWTNPLTKYAVGFTFATPASSVASFYPGFFGRAVNTFSLYVRADTGNVNALNLRTDMVGSNINQYTMANATIYDVVIAREPTGTNAGTNKLFINGVLVVSNAITNTALPDLSAQPWMFGQAAQGGSNNWRGKMFRTFMENLTTSTRTAEQVADASWAIVNGRFSA